jgi:hypothetical protein
MSIIVSVKINEGIVMAADSATTFFFPPPAPPHIYEHANKIVNLVKGLPIGVMTCGAAGIGNASMATLLKDMRRRLAGQESSRPEWSLEPANYTMEFITACVREFVAEKIAAAPFDGQLLLRVCGYSSQSQLPEEWAVVVQQGQVQESQRVQSETDIGIRWSGDAEALTRLVTGLGADFHAAAVQAFGLSDDQVAAAMPKLRERLEELVVLAAAPIQDAIDLARFLVETTKGFMRFAVKRPNTVGGAVEIASITKHEGFKWVQRKHFYGSELNSGA